MKHEGKSLRERVQSDHLVLYWFVNMKPMISQKLPRIDKIKLIERVENLTRKKLNAFRKDPLIEFEKLRDEFKTNKIISIRKKIVEDRSKI